jgi:hypothetical protein
VTALTKRTITAKNVGYNHKLGEQLKIVYTDERWFIRLWYFITFRQNKKYWELVTVTKIINNDQIEIE